MRLAHCAARLARWPPRARGGGCHIYRLISFRPNILRVTRHVHRLAFSHWEGTGTWSIPFSKHKTPGSCNKYAGTIRETHEMGSNPFHSALESDRTHFQMACPLEHPKRYMLRSTRSNATLCDNCCKALQKPLVCGRCKTATYCSKDCQVRTAHQKRVAME